MTTQSPDLEKVTAANAFGYFMLPDCLQLMEMTYPELFRLNLRLLSPLFFSDMLVSLYCLPVVSATLVGMKGLSMATRADAGLVIGCLIIWHGWRLVSKVRKATNTHPLAIRYGWNEYGIFSVSPKHQGMMCWADFRGWRESRKYLLLRVQTGWVVLVKRALPPEDQDALRNLIRRKVHKKRAADVVQGRVSGSQVVQPEDSGSVETASGLAVSCLEHGLFPLPDNWRSPLVHSAEPAQINRKLYWRAVAGSIAAYMVAAVAAILVFLGYEPLTRTEWYDWPMAGLNLLIFFTVFYDASGEYTAPKNPGHASYGWTSDHLFIGLESAWDVYRWDGFSGAYESKEHFFFDYLGSLVAIPLLIWSEGEEQTLREITQEKIGDSTSKINGC